MGIWQALARLFGGPRDDTFGVEDQPVRSDALPLDELARRLDVDTETIRGTGIAYRRFERPKRAGGTRQIAEPGPELKDLQRRIARRLLARLAVHPAATGFRPGVSVVHNALPHVGQAVVLRMDLRDFFPRTQAERIGRYFRAIGWDAEAAGELTRLCTLDGGLPQGAPTSPVLSNLVNYRLDARLAALAGAVGGAYTRYADDLTFSLAIESRDAVGRIIRTTKSICGEFGYRLHQDKKLRIARRHNRQLVTGLVVNDLPNLPRKTRRWLRAVRHHIETGRTASLTVQQYNGWVALEQMIYRQSQQDGEFGIR